MEDLDTTPDTPVVDALDVTADLHDLADDAAAETTEESVGRGRRRAPRWSEAVADASADVVLAEGARQRRRRLIDVGRARRGRGRAGASRLADAADIEEGRRGGRRGDRHRGRRRGGRRDRVPRDGSRPGRRRARARHDVARRARRRDGARTRARAVEPEPEPEPEPAARAGRGRRRAGLRRPVPRPRRLVRRAHLRRLREQGEDQPRVAHPHDADGRQDLPRPHPHGRRHGDQGRQEADRAEEGLPRLPAREDGLRQRLLVRRAQHARRHRVRERRHGHEADAAQSSARSRRSSS